MKKKAVILLIILGGLLMVFSINNQRQKTAEDERNRQYEVSLVKALKSNYDNISEIIIKDVEFEDKPTNWHCQLVVSFLDGKQIQFGTSYNISTNKFSTAGIKRKQNGDWEYLQSHRGETVSAIKIIYSNGEEGFQ
ncbi:hypothetical protein BVE84_06330 [Streptococcus azizii]|uniref:DUF1433 domain-containing protein n=1 Tax=Streptococcus azizii TaxID=1579424 RepID=A0AB36JRQ4_9STRE|nr:MULTISPECIES: hypothetical protein [Streptococcus]MBF0776868.1 hypothetical protein [Streptococcus sp. 19428wD3_AN2]ONK27060.1 hypothetical protein BVE86_05695 [Streptococcus azizii]ONK28413.1 hypothetical protein BVE85_04555 [Streptococcus azizii]ONK28493.1 hypothetical protein BVE84_06330 [Streptococcus azizii]TFU82224.1 hypothetical protein E4T83_08955 [Streptococcus sp. AN2]